MPTFSDAACKLIVRPPSSSTSPKGTTANVTSTGTTLRIGARKWRSRSLPAGTTSSFSRNLTGSATSVFTSPMPAKPRIAARFAPMRSWISALTFRSKKTPRPITCKTSSTMKRDFAAAIATSAMLLAGEALDQRERTGDVEVLVIRLVVDLQDRRRAARREALHLLEREAAVARALAVTDAEPLLERTLDRARAAQLARQVPAELEVPASPRLLPVHRVERCDRGDPRERQLHQRRHVLEDRERQPAEVALREPERRHERRASRRVAREKHAVLGERRLAELRTLSGHTHRRSC